MSVEKKDKGRIQYIIQIIGIILIATGFALAILTFYRFFICGYCLNKAIVYLILGILSAGIILLTIENVLGGIIKKRIEKYFDEISDEDFEKLIKEEFLDRLLVKADEKKEAEIALEKEIDTTKDTLIVPIGLTYEWVKEYNIYFYPKSRSNYNDTTHIAFYYKKQIIMAGTRNTINSDEAEQIFGPEKTELFVKEFSTLENYTFIQVTNPSKRIVRHNEPFAFVQNRRYVNFIKLMDAKTTEDL